MLWSQKHVLSILDGAAADLGLDRSQNVKIKRFAIETCFSKAARRMLKEGFDFSLGRKQILGIVRRLDPTIYI